MSSSISEVEFISVRLLASPAWLSLGIINGIFRAELCESAWDIMQGTVKAELLRMASLEFQYIFGITKGSLT